eukprot:191025-Amphidinium_carterae.1
MLVFFSTFGTILGEVLRPWDWVGGGRSSVSKFCLEELDMPQLVAGAQTTLARPSYCMELELF